MRGCTCHFAIKRLYARPSVALIIYHERRHVNKGGFICHGPLDRDAIGPGAKKVPYICSEIQQQTMSLIYLGIPEENVLQTHMEGVQRYCGPNASVNTLASQYVQKLGMIIKRSTHELDLDDQASIRMWVEKNTKSVFFYQDSTETDPFILGIQTEWQLQRMIRFSHQSILACDSSFGINKLKVIYLMIHCSCVCAIIPHLFTEACHSCLNCQTITCILTLWGKGLSFITSGSNVHSRF